MSFMKSGSKKAIGKNIEVEMDHGKPRDQSLAIALSVQRKHKRKKMADGGLLSAKDEKRPMPDSEFHDEAETSKVHASTKEQLSAANESRPSLEEKHNDSKSASKIHTRQDGPQSLNWKNDFMKGIDDAKTPEEFMMMMAQGGYVSPQDEPMESMNVYEDDDQGLDMVSDIMSRKRMADGGEVDLDLNAEEQPNSFYERNEDAVLKENYDSDMDGLSQPEDSNEHADSHESDAENEHDDIDQIRKRMRLRKGR